MRKILGLIILNLFFLSFLFSQEEVQIKDANGAVVMEKQIEMIDFEKGAIKKRRRRYLKSERDFYHMKIGEKVSLELKGHKSIKYRAYKASGNEGNFSLRTGMGIHYTAIEQTTDLTLTANIAERLRIGGRLFEYPFSEDKEVNFFSEAYFAKSGAKLSGNFGKVQADLKGGEFAAFTKEINGIKVVYKEEAGRIFSSVLSQSRSSTKTDTFYGRNIKGPYNLSSNRIVAGSEVVMLNGAILPSAQYSIDYFLGDIYFKEILLPTDKVEVSYDTELVGSLTEGALVGFSGEIPLGKNFNVGFFYASQKAHKLAGGVDEEFKEEGIDYKAISDDSISLKHKFINKKTEEIRLGDILLKPQEHYEVDYTPLKYDACPKIIFKVAKTVLESSGPMSISYRYYKDEFVSPKRITERIYKENLKGNIYFIQSQWTIYSGSEILKSGDSVIDTSRYAIREQDNLIEILDNGLIPEGNEFLEISFFGVYTLPPAASKFDRNTIDLYTNFSLSKNFNMQAEIAHSNSDVSGKGIFVKGELVGGKFIEKELNCEGSSFEGIKNECRFILSHKPLIEDSDQIYFNDILGENMKIRWRDYKIENYETGEIVITTYIATGTKIFANYQYKPFEEGTIKKGKAYKLGMGINLGKANVEANIIKRDAFFSPLGSLSSMEIDRLDMKGAFKLGENFFINSGFSRFKIANDISEKNLEDVRQVNLQLGINKLGFFNNVSARFSSNRKQDNLSLKDIDSKDTNYEIVIPIKLEKFKSTLVGFSFSNGMFKDYTKKSPDRDIKKISVNFNTNPFNNFQMSGAFLINELGNRTEEESYTNTNKTKNLNLEYSLKDFFYINAKIDDQDTYDTRESSLSTSISKRDISFLSKKSIWKIKNLALLYSKEDKPNIQGGGYGNEFLNLKFLIDVSKKFLLEQGYSVIKSSFMNDSSSEAEFWQLKFGWEKGKKKPIRCNFTYKIGEREIVTAESKSKYDLTNITLITSYEPKKVFLAMFRFDLDEEGGKDGYTIKNNELTATYKFSDKLNMNFIYTKINKSGRELSTENIFKLVSEYKISDFLSWNSELRGISFKNKNLEDSNYRGFVFENELKAKF